MEENLTASLLHSHVISISQLPVPLLSTTHMTVEIFGVCCRLTLVGWQVPTTAALSALLSCAGEGKYKKAPESK